LVGARARGVLAPCAPGGVAARFERIGAAVVGAGPGVRRGAGEKLNVLGLPRSAENSCAEPHDLGRRDHATIAVKQRRSRGQLTSF